MVAIFAAIAGTLMALSVAAQPVKLHPKLGSRTLTEPYVENVEGSRLVITTLAGCANQRTPDRVLWFLLHSDDLAFSSRPDGQDIGTFLGLARCADLLAEAKSSGLEMKMTQASLRGALAEQAYLQSHPAYNPPPEASVERQYFSAGDALSQARALGQYEDCLAETDPAAGDTLLRTPVGSAEETAAAKAMASTLGSCLLEGQSLALTPANVRNFVAQGMWQRFNAGTDKHGAAQ